MKRLIYFLLFFTLVSTSVSAQVPGYRGKKFIFKVNMKGMPLSGFFLSDEKALDFNIRFSAGMDVVLSRSFTAGVSIEQTNDLVQLKKYEVSPTYPVYSSGYDGRPPFYYTSANLYGYSYGGNIKFFTYRSSGSLAPFGRFIIAEYYYNKLSLTDDGRFYSSGKKNLNDIQSHTFLLGVGSQKIYFNCITLEGNVKIGLNTYGLQRIGKGQNDDTAVKRYNQDEVYRVSTAKMFSDFMINVGVGIGFLAF